MYTEHPSRVVVLCVLLCVLITVTLASPVSSTTESPKKDLTSALENYVKWMELVSDQFSDDVITHVKLVKLEENGEKVHDDLIDALKGLKFKPQNDTESKAILKILESVLTKSHTDNEKILGLLFADSIVSNQGSRLAINSRIFATLALRLRQSLDEEKLEDVQDQGKLKNIFNEVQAAEIAFEAILDSFQVVEDLVTDTDTDDVKNDITDNDDVSSNDVSKRDVKSRSKRQTNGFNLGGGFSTNGRSLAFTRGRTTARLTPHFSLRPKLRFQGATGGFNHRFRNGRGSVFGSATVNHRGRFTGAHVGFRIRF